MEQIEMDWSRWYQMRVAIKKKFPTIWALPLIKKEMALIAKHLSSGVSVLEVGAGDRRMAQKIGERQASHSYKSFDIDRSTHHDFYRLEDIQGEYGLIFSFEVIEHIRPVEGVAMLRGLKKHLAPGGVLIVGTPNLYHPHRYFGDVTHVTPYKYEELGALLLASGYQVTGFYRIYNDSFFRRLLRIYCSQWLHRWLDIDFAHTILVEAVKGE
jgi:SAM-dependent methyltransferase